MSTYDPRFHVTARELRAAGYLFDEAVPGDAWVPRGSVQLERGETPHSPLKPVFLAAWAGIEVVDASTEVTGGE